MMKIKHLKDLVSRNKIRYLVYVSIAIFAIINYGQNLLELDSEARKDFYFVGMALFRLIISTIILLHHTKIYTKILFGLMLGSFLNEIIFSGSLSYIELMIIFISLIISSLK